MLYLPINAYKCLFYIGQNTGMRSGKMVPPVLEE